MDNFLLLIALGFAVGILSGMGVGGGSLLIIILTVFMDVEQRIAQGINLLYFLPTAAVAAFIHFKSGKIKKDVAIKSGSAGIITAIAFSVMAQNLEPDLLRKVFAILVFGAGLSELFSKKEQEAK